MLSLDTKLVAPTSAGSMYLVLPAADMSVLCGYLDGTRAVVLELHTHDGSELVRATRCADGRVVVERGVRGTAARVWPVNTCVCVVDEEPFCVEGDGECDPCNLPNPWDMVTVGPALDLNRDDPAAPVLDVKRTGVLPGDYGGARVDEYGRFTYIPPGWPASALPVYDPCGCGDSGGTTPGDVTAQDVAYAPCGFVTGTNVQDALCQLEQWASGLSFDGGVMSVTAGDGITISGSSTDPVVALTPTGITPGTYAGFQVNAFGQIVSFTPVAVDHPQHQAVVPLRVTYDAGTNTWAHTVDQADYGGVWGVTTYVSVADITNGTVPPADRDYAITYEGAEALVNRMLSSIGAQFDISALPVAGGVTGTDDIAVYNYTTNQHERLQIGDLADFLPGVSVLLEYDPVSSTTPVSDGVLSVTTTTTGVHQVQLTDPLTNAVVHVDIRGANPLAVVRASVVSSTVIEVRTYDLSVAGTTLQATPADHPFWLSVHEAA